MFIYSSAPQIKTLWTILNINSCTLSPTVEIIKILGWLLGFSVKNFQMHFIEKVFIYFLLASL